MTLSNLTEYSGSYSKTTGKLGNYCRDKSNNGTVGGIKQNSDKDISDFQISGQLILKVNCHNSRTSDDINMKLGPVTKIDKRNKAVSKYLDDHVM